MTSHPPRSWVKGAAGSLYDVDNLPYGVFVRGDGPARIGARIGDHLVDLASVAAGDLPAVAHALENQTLNALLALGRPAWTSVRTWLVGVLTDETKRDIVEPQLIPLDEVTMQLPFEVADYVDFYASLDHASNVGKIFRPDAAPLLPNWRHLPVGYHGRAGTVVVSGAAVRRPQGQRRSANDEGPTFGPTQRLDIEAELGFVVGVPSELGTSVPTSAFADHVFGLVGLNDWSARDIQAWEYVPLGPFLGKSFATSISAWVTPLEALDQARVDLPRQDPPPLPYLRVAAPGGYDIEAELTINGEVLSRPPYRSMYWGPAQMLAHMTVNGASLRTGDLFGSGTISGPERDQCGSLLELSWGGREPWLSNGVRRCFLEDGDEVTLRFTAPGALGRIGLGDVHTVIQPCVL